MFTGYVIISKAGSNCNKNIKCRYTLQETKTLDNYKLDDTVYTWQFSADNRQAEALYQSFTVRNVILGIEDMSKAGGVGMLMLAVVFILMAARKRKDENELV